MTLFPTNNPYDPRKLFHEKTSSEDLRDQQLMAEARAKKERAELDPGKAALERDAKILEGRTGEDRYRRETLLLHRRGEYRLSDTARERERLKKRRHRRNRRARAEAAQEMIVAGSNRNGLAALVEAEATEQALERIAVMREREEAVQHDAGRQERRAAFERLQAATARRLAAETKGVAS